MAEHPRFQLASEIRKLLQQELGTFGLTVFNTQCSELNIKPEEIKTGDLLRLSQAVIRAVRPSMGDEKAQGVGKEIQKLKVQTELEGLKGRESEPGSQRRLADLFVSLGNLCQSTGDFEEGVRAYKKAVLYAKDADYPLKEAEAYLGIGHIREKENKWDGALDYLKRGLSISERIDYPMGIADAAKWMGHLHWHKSEYDDAMKWLEKSLENAERTGNDGIIGASMIEFGLVYSDLGDLDKAVEWYKKAIPLLENVRDYKQVARVYNNMGDSALQTKDFKKALSYFDKCKDYASMINNQMFLGWSLFNSGEALVSLGEPDEAIERAERALTFLDPATDQMGMHGGYRVMAMAYANKNEWDKAEEFFGKSLELVEELDSKYYIGKTQHYRALMYAEKGDIKTAKKLLKQAKEQLKSIGAERLLEEVNSDLEKL
jgi:tetratricopeptide (TPR) repeat protein